MAGTKRLFRVGPLTTAGSRSYIPHSPLSTSPAARFILLVRPHWSFIPAAGLARKIADRNFSNFPNGSFLVEKSSGQLKGTRWLPESSLPPPPTRYPPHQPRTAHENGAGAVPRPPRESYIPSYRSSSIQFLRREFSHRGTISVTSRFREEETRGCDYRFAGISVWNFRRGFFRSFDTRIIGGRNCQPSDHRSRRLLA